MDQLIELLNVEQIVPLFLFALLAFVGGGIATAAIILGHWRELREKELARGMIERMLDRKVPADEIARIIVAWRSAPAEDAEEIADLQSKIKSIPPAASKAVFKSA